MIKAYTTEQIYISVEHSWNWFSISHRNQKHILYATCARTLHSQSTGFSHNACLVILDLTNITILSVNPSFSSNENALNQSICLVFFINLNKLSTFAFISNKASLYVAVLCPCSKTTHRVLQLFIIWNMRLGNDLLTFYESSLKQFRYKFIIK